MKQRYQSPAWISAALDDAGLTPHEFRVLAHVCRRAGDGSNGRGCDASISSISRTCSMKRDTVRSCLQSLESAGWIRRDGRPGMTAEIYPRFPDVVADPSPQSATFWPDEGRGGGQKGGDEGNPSRNTLKGTRTDTEFPSEGCGASPHPSDGILGRVPARALENDGKQPEVAEDEARGWALQIHAAEGRSADSTLAMFPPEEVEAWAVDWLVTMQARGWQLDGAPVANPRAALRGYLRKAANGRSKRFREVSSGNCELADLEP